MARKYGRFSYCGVMTNYTCTANCAHCMFASSPNCKKEYMSKQSANRIADILLEHGTDSVHIGGGEPFMNFGALCDTVEALTSRGIMIDYIETNAFWCQKESMVRERLQTLKRLGADTVMASVDPFHVQFIPLERPLMLIDCLRKEHMGFFIWKEQFLRRLSALDKSVTHSDEELKALLGENYIVDCAREYGVKVNGRAMNIARHIFPLKPASTYFNSPRCINLMDGVHCHIDNFEKVIPQGCPGINIDIDDFAQMELEIEKYPVVSALMEGGVKKLYEYALNKGYKERRDGYSTACELCSHIRSYLFYNSPSGDIGPKGFYDNLFTE